MNRLPTKADKYHGWRPGKIGLVGMGHCALGFHVANSLPEIAIPMLFGRKQVEVEIDWAQPLPDGPLPRYRNSNAHVEVYECVRCKSRWVYDAGMAPYWEAPYVSRYRFRKKNKKIRRSIIQRITKHLRRKHESSREAPVATGAGTATGKGLQGDRAVPDADTKEGPAGNG